MRQVMCDLDPGRYSDVYIIAHSEMTVDKSNNFAPALPDQGAHARSRDFRFGSEQCCACASCANQTNTLSRGRWQISEIRQGEICDWAIDVGG